MKNFLKEKIFWQKYANEELSKNDLFEIDQNLLNFAKALLKIQMELNLKKGTKNERK